MLCLLGSLLISTTHPTPAQNLSAMDLKFQMLKAIPFYLAWPEHQKPKELRICIIANRNPFRAQMADLIPQVINGVPVTISFTTEIRNPPAAEIYYLALEHDALAVKFARIRKNDPVICVSSAPFFSQRGGDIHFHEKFNRVVLEVNQASIKAKGITPRSQLLRLSQRQVK